MTTEFVQIGRWVLRPDVRRTLEAHSKLTASGATACGCIGCLNFEAVRSRLLEGPLGSVLEKLGISPPWEVEVYELGRAPSGLHHYGGWFHFVGTIESGAPALRSGSADFEQLSSTVSIGFHAAAQLVRPSFKGAPIVQLEVSAELPWVIDAEEPS